jgi:uncharacterized membrane protein
MEIGLIECMQLMIVPGVVQLDFWKKDTHLNLLILSMSKIGSIIFVHSYRLRIIFANKFSVLRNLRISLMFWFGYE